MIFFFVLCVFFFVCMYVCTPCVCLVSTKSKRECSIPWSWIYKWLWATLGSLESSLNTLLGHFSSSWFCADKNYLTLWSACFLPEFFSFWKESQWSPRSGRMKASQMRKLALVWTSFLCILTILYSQLQTRSILQIVTNNGKKFKKSLKLLFPQKNTLRKVPFVIFVRLVLVCFL